MQEIEEISYPDAEGVGMSGGREMVRKDLLLLAISALQVIHSESQEGNTAMA